MYRVVALAACLWLPAALGAAAEAGSEALAILERRCVQCHGPTTRMGDLDLSARESALRGGTRGPALDTAAPSSSLLLARVLGDEMPPGSPLTTADKQVLREWIEAGSRWPAAVEERRAGLEWWSFQPLRASPPPPLPAAGGPIASPVDFWIGAALEEAGLRPAPLAERRHLMRRLTFALTGLPPEPEALEAFARDESPDAYERLVDRLLASPHYGERWGRHWLDLVRFAESEGFERDLPRYHAWPYRDYVLRSFNEDKPYLQFAREQIAGDAIEGATRDSVVATTMLTLGPVDAVGLTSAIPEERMLIREDLLEEMLGTVTQTFLGLTVNCARCHDHKFDPISQEEYYRMKAAFQAVWPPTRPVPDRGLDELFPHGSPLLAPEESRARESRIADLEKRIEAVDAGLGALYRRARPPEDSSDSPPPLARWAFHTDGRADGAPLHLRLVGEAEIAAGALRKRVAPEKPPAGTEQEEAGPGSGAGFGVSGLIGADIRAKTLEAWIDVRSVPEKAVTVMEIRGLSGFRGASVDGIRLETGDRPRWENSSVGRFRSADTGGVPEALEAGSRIHVAIAYAEDGTIAIYRNGQPYGQPYRPDQGIPAGRLQAYRAGDALVRFPASEHLHVAEARLYDAALAAPEIAASHGAGTADLTGEQLRGRMGPEARRHVAELERKRAALLKELEGIPEPDLAHAVSVRAMEPTHILLRGAVDRPGRAVQPGGLSCINGLSPDLGLSASASEGARRRAMARWIASPANPLFARVIVNRVWQRHFGRGLVANPSDFGYNGGQPSHPELLDWLASDLARDGWSLKRLHRKILLSRAYRQSSRFDHDAASKDAGNRLLWRFPPRRLDAESVRDSMLAVSADLNRAFHGPSFQPFRFGEARGSLKSYVLTGDDSPAMRRRTIYRMNVITGGDPMLEALDCPLPSVKAPQRRSTTTALQALSLMNNDFVQRRAEGFAARLRAEAGSMNGRVRRAFALALGRQPDSRELAESVSLAQEHGLATLCWGLLNTSEFLYVR